MRVMEIPPFPRQVEITDLDNLIRNRLSQPVVLWPAQAIPLLGYMCYPSDGDARGSLIETLRSWEKTPEGEQPAVPENLDRIQRSWLRVADVLHQLADLVAGEHQKRRGGPSIGKAITLTEANAKSRGTAAANLWKTWSNYKDVAHLVTAATIICAEARQRYMQRPLATDGLKISQFMPFQMTMLMPDFVLGVALDLQRLGLELVPHAVDEPTLDPNTLWRIPENINVTPLAAPVRKIRPQDIEVLNRRRAGNRGIKSAQSKPDEPSAGDIAK
jgi:hypothetical protein